MPLRITAHAKYRQQYRRRRCAHTVNAGVTGGPGRVSVTIGMTWLFAAGGAIGAQLLPFRKTFLPLRYRFGMFLRHLEARGTVIPGRTLRDPVCLGDLVHGGSLRTLCAWGNPACPLIPTTGLLRIALGTLQDPWHLPDSWMPCTPWSPSNAAKKSVSVPALHGRFPTQIWYAVNPLRTGGSLCTRWPLAGPCAPGETRIPIDPDCKS